MISIPNKIGLIQEALQDFKKGKLSAFATMIVIDSIVNPNPYNTIDEPDKNFIYRSIDNEKES